jgi:hypothetical protein
MENRTNGDMPTEKQINTIRRLAGQAKSYIDIKGISSKKQASEIIKSLLEKKESNNGNGSGKVSNDNANKIAYGLALQLVSARYQQQNIDIKAESFWTDVDEFYKSYLEHQDRAVKLGLQG